MAVTKGTVQITIKIDGKDNSAKAAAKAAKAVNKLEATVEEAGSTISVSLGDRAKATLAGLSDGLVDSAAKFSLLSIGADLAGKALGAIGERAKEGAQAADRIDALRGSVEDLDGVIARVKASTTGMIPEAEITKAIALFDSFDIPVDQLDRALAAVAKTAVKTGQDATFLTDSLVSGIARESAMRLDNLGIIVKVEDATKRAAEATGKSVDAITAQERKAALLTMTLEQLEEKTASVDLVDSQTAAIARLEAGYEDLANEVGGFLAGAAIGVIDFFEITDRTLQLQQVRMTEVAATASNLQRRIQKLASKSDRASNIEEENKQLAAQAQLTEELGDATQVNAELNAVVAAARSEAAAVFAEETAGVIRHLEQRSVGLVDVAEKRQLVIKRAKELRGLQNEAAEAARQEFLAERAANIALDEGIEVIRRRMLAAKGMTDTEIELLSVERLLGAAERELQKAVKDGTNEMRTAAKERIKIQLEEQEQLQEFVAAEKELEAERKKRSRRRPRKKSDKEKALGTPLFKIVESKEFKTQLAAEANIARAQKARLESLAERGRELIELEKKKNDERARGMELLRQEAGVTAMLASNIQDQIDAKEQAVTRAVAGGAITEAEAADSREQLLLERRLDRMNTFATAMGDAASVASQSQNEAVAGFGRMAEAAMANTEAILGGGAGAIAASGDIAAAFVEDEQLKAAIKSATELAAGFASSAVGDGAGALGHFTASALYGAAALTTPSKGGGAGGGGGGAGGRSADARPITRQADEEREPRNLVFNINAPVVGGSAAEIAAQFEGFERANRGTGMGAEV